MNPKGKKQFWITTPQLAALGVISLSLAALAFFLGLMVGRSQFAGAAEPASAAEMSAGLITNDIESDSITELLARVEQAAEKHQDAPSLAFPEALVEEELEPRLPEALPEPEPEPFVVEADQGANPQEPEPPQSSEPSTPQALPATGWAVQVASYPNSEEAHRHLERLKSDGHKAYLISALVKGQTWYRVRVGPYETKEGARSAQGALSELLGRADLLVTGVQ